MKNKNKNEVKKFCEEHCIAEDQFYGKEKIECNLNLSSVTELPAGFNPTVCGWLYLCAVEILPSGFNPTVGGDLWLDSVKSLPSGFNPAVGGSLRLDSVKELHDGFNPTVGRNLWLNSVKELPKGFNPTVGGSIYLNSVKSIHSGFNPIVGGSIDLSSVKSIHADFNPTVGGYLWLSSVEELPNGFNPTVGGNLYLGSVKSLPAGFNPTVGGYLDLRYVKELPNGFNPTVGGYLNLSSVETLPAGFYPTVGGYLYTKDSSKRICSLPNNGMLSWQNGKYVSVDGIFAEVIKKRGNIYHTKLIGKDEILYLVTDGNGTWAHGSTLSEAKEDLIYKNTSRNKDDYNSLTLDSELSFSDAVTCYRVITGACAAGVREFVERKLKGSKKNSRKFTIKGVIDMTEGEYGHDAFVKFFNK